MKTIVPKIRLVVLLAALIAAGISVFVLRSPDEEGGAATVFLQAEPSEELQEGSQTNSPSGANHDGEGSALSPASSTNAPMVSLVEIPSGIFRDQLLQLSPVARQTALTSLSEMQFNPKDVGSLRVDQQGGIFFVCTFETDGEGEGHIKDEGAFANDVNAIPDVAGASVPISSPPIRHSRSGASKVLFLDFNGAVISNTLWNANTNYGPTASWDCRPYNTDGDETTFSSTEQANIIQIWERVAEDYASFDVDVTTEQPAAWTSTTGHALITPTTDKDGKHCPHYGYGGIAYVNVFGFSNYSYNSAFGYSPAWINKDMSMDSIAEAASHELGHNMGLSHDGTDVGGEAYYDGHANDSISWGPIMGTGYGRNVSQWCKGEYYDANQHQDDLSIISGKLAYRPDDYGDNNASASALTVDTEGAVSQSGVIETTGDPDVFSFSTGTGNITITASSYRAATSTWGGNLDILLELYDSGGALIATNNPTLEVNATLSLSVSAGSYFLHVKPVGVGDPMASTPTGYTVYGSLGQYWLTGMVSADADGDGIPNEWEVLYFSGFTNAVATADSDGDGADNLTEYISGYDPNNSNSVFKVVTYAPPATGNAPFIVTWNPVAGRIYGVEWSDGLLYTPFTNISGDLPPPVNSYTDTVERTSQQNFYRVDVRLEP